MGRTLQFEQHWLWVYALATFWFRGKWYLMFEKQTLLCVQVRSWALSGRGDRTAVKGLERETGILGSTRRNTAQAAGWGMRGRESERRAVAAKTRERRRAVGPRQRQKRCNSWTLKHDSDQSAKLLGTFLAGSALPGCIQPFLLWLQPQPPGAGSILFCRVLQRLGTSVGFLWKEPELPGFCLKAVSLSLKAVSLSLKAFLLGMRIPGSH